jgi:peptide deformylase
MIIEDIIQIGNEKAREKSAPVEDFNDPLLKKIIRDLSDTMEPAGLIGMAAPQIGENFRVFLTHLRKTASRAVNSIDDVERIFINPRITWHSKEEEIDYEGCGSVASGEIFGPVSRAKKLKVEAFNEKGERFTLEAEGLLARVIQHEYDHLEGVFFIERVTDNKKLLSKNEYLKARQEKRI